MNTFKKTWFRDTSEPDLFINENAVRIRAGIMMFIPFFMVLTFFYVFYTSPWIVDPSTVKDTYDLDAASNIIYSGDMKMRIIDYTPQTLVLIYALFELLVSMTVWSSRFSPTIQLAALLTRNQPPVWKPLAPKRFAWGSACSWRASVSCSSIPMYLPDGSTRSLHITSCRQQSTTSPTKFRLRWFGSAWP